MISALIAPLAFLAIGLFCATRPDIVASWFKSLSRPIGRDAGASIISQKVQERQATSRPIFIRLLGVIFAGVGIWALFNLCK
jgi:hypothetical protein